MTPAPIDQLYRTKQSVCAPLVGVLVESAHGSTRTFQIGWVSSQHFKDQQKSTSISTGGGYAVVCIFDACESRRALLRVYRRVLMSALSMRTHQQEKDAHFVARAGNLCPHGISCLE